MQQNANGVPTTPVGRVPSIPNQPFNGFLGKEDWKSHDITEITKALCKSQNQMSSVVQSKVNPFYGSAYADINDLLKAVLPIITKNGLAVTQGNRFCKETSGFYVTTTLCHISGQWIRSEIRIPMFGKKDAQIVGQMCTYGRRYGLGAILGISVTKDDDGNSIRNEEENK